jgi:hypothetical protein
MVIRLSEEDAKRLGLFAQGDSANVRKKLPAGFGKKRSKTKSPQRGQFTKRKKLYAKPLASMISTPFFPQFIKLRSN